MAITAISVLRRDPALANASGLIAGSSGPPGTPGLQGNPGADGQPGPTGRSIASVAVNGSSHIIITYSDGTTSDAGPVTVPPSSGSDGGTY